MKCCKSQNLNSLLANILEFANINHKNWKNQKLKFFFKFWSQKISMPFAWHDGMPSWKIGTPLVGWHVY